MKKMMLIALMLVATTTSFAQIYIKPMVGGTLANVTKSDMDYKFGLVAGGEVEFPVASQFSITGGLLYSMQGAKKDDYKMNLDYLNIPVLANIYVAPGFALKAGVQLGIKANAEAKYGDTKLDISDSFKSTVFDIPVGLSYEFNDFVIDARYNIGITNVSEPIKAFGFKEEVEGKNSVFMLTLGYKFGI